ncbi:MAG: hypothetical protein D4R97_07915 [Bacteroidetes bacterium]|nr:MAG: hypothetical protein D4R97_07915 [Bacteroidota bacterium]
MLSCSKSKNDTSSNTETYSFPYRVHFWNITDPYGPDYRYQYIYNDNRIFQKSQEYPVYLLKQYFYSPHHLQIIHFASNITLTTECELNDQGFIVNEVRVRSNGYDSAAFFYENGYLKKMTINFVNYNTPATIGSTMTAVEFFEYLNGNLVKWKRSDTTFYGINNFQTTCEYFSDIKNTLNINFVDFRFGQSLDFYTYNNGFPDITENLGLYGKFNTNLVKSIHYSNSYYSSVDSIYTIDQHTLDSENRITSIIHYVQNFNNPLPYEDAFIYY